MTAPKFPEEFAPSVREGDSLSWTDDSNGAVYTATIVLDPEAGIDDNDAHNEEMAEDDETRRSIREAREAYLRGDWWYAGIVLTVKVSFGKHRIKGTVGSLWAVEANYPGSDNSYLTEVANELLEEAVAKSLG